MGRCAAKPVGFQAREAQKTARANYATIGAPLNALDESRSLVQLKPHVIIRIIITLHSVKSHTLGAYVFMSFIFNSYRMPCAFISYQTDPIQLGHGFAWSEASEDLYRTVHKTRGSVLASIGLLTPLSPLTYKSTTYYHPLKTNLLAPKPCLDRHSVNDCPVLQLPTNFQ
jgi:hypothetical protein